MTTVQSYLINCMKPAAKKEFLDWAVAEADNLYAQLKLHKCKTITISVGYYEISGTFKNKDDQVYSFIMLDAKPNRPQTLIYRTLNKTEYGPDIVVPMTDLANAKF